MIVHKLRGVFYRPQFGHEDLFSVYEPMTNYSMVLGIPSLPQVLKKDGVIRDEVFLAS